MIILFLFSLIRFGGLEERNEIIQKKKIMSNFIKTKTGKTISVLVGLTAGLLLLAGAYAPAHAQTVEEQIASLMATIEQLKAQLVSLQGGETATGAVCGYTFANDLKKGDTGTDVLNLQKVLNSDADTKVAESGVGSVGQETEYFGSLTKTAAIKFQNKYASEILAPLGLSAGTGYIGASSRAKLNALYGTCAEGEGTGTETGTGTGTGTETAGTGVTVGLSSDTPATTALIQGQATADLAHYTLVNSGSEDVKVTKITLNRIGVSADATLVNVYLFDGAVRLTDAATVSSGVITFNNSAGIITIPAGGSKVIAVKSDIDDSASGQIVGVALASVEANADVSGTFPIEGNKHSIATADLATVEFGDTTTPSANSSLEPQNDYVMWQNTPNIGTRSVYLKSLRLRMIGSVQSGDLKNFRLYVDGTQVGSAVDQYDADGYVTFDLTGAPVELKTGNRVIKMVGDVIGGSGRNFKFSLRQASDVEVTDKDYGQNVLAALSGGAFSARASGQQDVASGTITITKRDDSPSANVKLDDSSVVLAKFDVKAAGESMKIESLKVSVDSSDNNVGKLRNGALFADGVQIGSTADIVEYNSSSATTTYNFGSSLIVNPGSPVVLEVRADTYDSNGTNDLSANDTLKVYIAAGSDNVQQMTSLGYVSNSEKTGNTVTVVTGSMSLAKYSAYANQTAVVPQTAYKIGEYRLSADETEDVNLTTITLTIGGSGLATSTDLTDLYVVYGGNTSAVKASGAASQSWSINKTIPANTTWNVAVYADLSAAITDGDTIISSLNFEGTTVSSSQSINTGTIAGQTITAGVGSFAVAADASKPVVALNVANSAVKVAAFKFTATNETYTIDRLGVSVSGDSQDVIQNVVLKDHLNGAELASQPFNGAYATSTGFSFVISANTDKVMDVYLQLAGVGVGATTTGQDVKVTLNGYRVKNTQGSTTNAYPSGITGNNEYVVKSLPTLAMLTTSDKLGAGTQTIGKFTVAADAAGTISWKEMLFNYGTSSALSLGSIALYDGTTEVLGTATLQNATGTIRFVADNEQEIGAGITKTYSLKATVGGTIDTGAYVQTSIADIASSLGGPAAYTAGLAGAGGSFIWSDKSVSSHGLTTADWFDDYKVPGVPTGSYSLNY